MICVVLNWKLNDRVCSLKIKQLYLIHTYMQFTNTSIKYKKKCIIYTLQKKKDTKYNLISINNVFFFFI